MEPSVRRDPKPPFAIAAANGRDGWKPDVRSRAAAGPRPSVVKSRFSHEIAVQNGQDLTWGSIRREGLIQKSRVAPKRQEFKIRPLLYFRSSSTLRRRSTQTHGNREMSPDPAKQRCRAPPARLEWCQPSGGDQSTVRSHCASATLFRSDRHCS